jgi:hypothetical protein
MTARYVREWPRMTAAAILVGLGLVLVGVVAASEASSGGGGQAATVTALRRANAAQAAQLRVDAQQLTGLRNQVQTDSAQLAMVQSELGSSRSLARCWQAKAMHPHRAPACPPTP